MARFSEEELDEIRRNTDIVALIESYGTKLKQRPDANEYVGLCPLHDDKDASLHVNRAKGVWHCKSGCGGGDCIAWVMKAEKVSFTHAVELLKAKAVGLIAGNGTKAAFARRLENPTTLTAEDHELLFQVAEFYHSQLKGNEAAMAYLASRGLADSEAITKFKIGVSDRSLGRRIPQKQVKAGREQRAKLEALGVMKEATGHEALRGCITFPVLTGESKVGEIYGRRYTRAPENQRHWYLKGPHVGVWNAEAFQASETIILCEGIIDALTFWIAGFRNVTCTYGKSGFTDEVFQKFIKSDTKRCYVGFDNDSKNDPSDNAALMAAERLMSQGIECFRIEYPLNANDANAYAMMLKDGNGTAHGPLQMLINNAVWMGKSSNKSSLILPASATQPNVSQGDEPFTEPAPRTKPYNIPPACDLFEQAEKRVAEQQTQAPKEESQPARGKDLLVTIPTQSIVDEPKKLLLLGAKTLEVATPTESNQTTAPVKMPTASLEAQIKDNEIIIPIGNRSYRIRGLARNTNGFDSMKVNVLARKGEAFFVDTLDIYAARGRNAFIKEASRELALEEEIIKRDLGKVLLKLEELQDSFALANVEANHKKIEISEPDKKKALELLRSKDLVERILADFDACGVVGEQNNKLVGYLSATSRKLKEPLAVLIQSSSAAGKSSLMEAVLAFMPAEETIKYSAMTGQSLFYMGGTSLKHRILAIAEEEGVEQAAYALKLLQSEGELNIASTGKDPGTGRMETQEYHVEGPVMLFLTTTRDDTDPELKNRCIVLGVCENACHTEAIHKQQRSKRTLDGIQVQNDRKAIRNLHQNAQRLIRPITVVNNYAEQLTFRSDKTKSRRAHGHYLTLIESIALLHQHQREQKTMIDRNGESIEYIEATIDDIELANRLADRFLERSFAELPERTNVLLEQIIGGVRNLAEFQIIELFEVRFTRKDVRRWSTFGDTQLKQHLARLVDYGYLRTDFQ